MKLKSDLFLLEQIMLLPRADVRLYSLLVRAICVGVIFSVIQPSHGHPQFTASAASDSSARRRQDVIREWIRTIREAPKGHSMSPSWTSKSRPQIIGVAELPLQNEAVPVSSSAVPHSSLNSLKRPKKSPPSLSSHRINSNPRFPSTPTKFHKFQGEQLMFEI